MVSNLAPPTQSSLTQQVTSGMLWVAGSAVIGRLASFGSQLVLGWLLVPEDFALYAIAVSVTSLLWFTKNGGLREVLTQRGQEYADLAPGAFRIALSCNMALALLFVAISPLLARLYEAPSLPPMIWIIALYLVGHTPGIVLSTKLSSDMRFATLGKISSASMVLRHFSAVCFALLGFGAMSLVLPMLFAAAFDSVAYLLALRSWPRGGIPVREVLRQALPAMRWVIFGTLAATLLEQGDYLTLGLLKDKQTLGLYFFGFQLCVALESLFITGLRAVMLPAFTRISDQPQRQNAAFLRSCRALSFLSAPICMAMVLVSEPLVDVLWGGRWNEAVPVFQLMLISLFARLLAPLSLALAESRGEWRMRSLLMAADGIGIVASAALGAALGGLVQVALWVSAYRILSGVTQCLFISQHAAIPTRQTLAAVMPPAIVSWGCALLGMASGHALLPAPSFSLQAMLSLGAFAILFSLASILLLRQHTREVHTMCKAVLHKPPPSTNTGGE